MNKNLKSLFCCILLAFLGQTTLAQEVFESYCGNKFKVGDTLMVGKPVIASFVSAKYEYTTESRGKTNVYYNKLRSEEYPPCSKLVIKEIIHPTEETMFFNKNVYMRVESELTPDRKIFVEIDNAISREEVAVSYSTAPLLEGCTEFTPDRLLVCCIRVNNLSITDDVVLDYIRAIDAKLGEECKKDQFKFYEVKDQYKKQLENDTLNFDFNQTFYIKKLVYRADKYDFEKKGYGLYYKTSSSHEEIFEDGFYYNGYNFIWETPNTVEFLPMETGNANAYEKRLRGVSGQKSASGLVYAVIYLQPLDKYIKNPKSKLKIPQLLNKYRNKCIGIKIKGQEFYDNESYKYNPIGTVLY